MLIRFRTIKDSQGRKEKALIFQPLAPFFLAVAALILALCLTAGGFFIGKHMGKPTAGYTKEQQDIIQNALFKAACIPLKDGDFEAALNIFEYLIRSHDRDLPAKIRHEIIDKQVQCLRNLNRLDEALRIVDAVIAEYPNKTNFLRLKAEILLQARNLEYASQFIQSIDNSGLGPQLWLLRGKLCLELKDYQGALKNLQNVFSFHAPVEEKDAARLLAILYSEKIRDFDEANRYVEILLKPEPTNSATCVTVGRVFLIQERYEKAKEYLLKAVSLDPDNVDAFLNLAVLFERQGQEERKSLYMEMAAQIDPESLLKYKTLNSF